MAPPVYIRIRYTFTALLVPAGRDSASGGNPRETEFVEQLVAVTTTSVCPDGSNVVTSLRDGVLAGFRSCVKRYLPGSYVWKEHSGREMRYRSFRLSTAQWDVHYPRGQIVVHLLAIICRTGYVRVNEDVNDALSNATNGIANSVTSASLITESEERIEKVIFASECSSPIRSIWRVSLKRESSSVGWRQARVISRLEIDH